MAAGRFVSLEGIEGAGKSTLVALLAEALRTRGHAVIVTREPGGTPAAERLRQIVLERGMEKITPVTETLLMFAARGMHLDNLVRPALQRGEWVLCDRYTDATRAYQGGGRGVSRELIEQLAQAVHGDCWPDLTLLLDLPVELGLQRVAARRTASDRIEIEASVFFGRVRARYLDIARDEPQRVRILDASAPSKTLLQQALGLLVELGA
jgi:dTMP kinase